jgi:putative holliday junction resolvase
MRFLGIDYGEKHIGIAVSDDGGTFAFPKEPLRNDALLIEQIISIVEDQGIGRIVVGDTRAFSGLENAITKEADAFMQRLRDETNLEVTPAWEAGSSIEASLASEDGAHSDSRAAAVILQRYLDMHPGR